MIQSEKGAALNYVPVSLSGLPNCGYLNSKPVLAFSDEFSGNTLDTAKWSAGYPWGAANSDSSNSWCDPAEIVLSGGTVKLGCNLNPNSNVLLNGSPIGCDYSIGAISSKQKFTYGYYQIRCKIPRIAELWPAFWLFGACAQEIDIFEFIGNQCKTSEKKTFHDKLSACSPHRNKWYIPQECASANPFMTYHTPQNALSGCVGNLTELRVCSQNLQFSEWDVKMTPLNFSKGCVYDNITVDVDFHKDWHTFGLAFTPESIVWFIDSVPVVAEYRYFHKRDDHLNFRQNFEPACLSEYCSGSTTEELYEQVNLPQGGIGMNIIINNNHKVAPDYNLPKWIEDHKNWEDSYLELDYFRYYTFTGQETSPYKCVQIQRKGFNVFPTISGGKITLQCSDGVQQKYLLITNTLGQIVFRDSFTEMEHVVTFSVSAGIYFVNLKTDAGMRTKKIIIE